MKDYSLRPITLHDLDKLENLIASSMTGLTSLPKNRDLLERLIKMSVRSFCKEVTKPKDESYFFVLEHLPTSEIHGVSGIFSKIGLKFPFYSYKVLNITKKSKSLKKEKTYKILKLLSISNGPSEIGGLYLDPNHRKKGLGKFLSLSRFMFIANWRQRFEKKVIAEMRGISSKSGRSPFWDRVGVKFFDVSFKEADLMTVTNRQFIDDLVPRYPIYVNLLPEDAQSVIGQPHKHTVPAFNFLKDQGFSVLSQVDIFDGGPKLRCLTKSIKSVKNTSQMTLNVKQGMGFKKFKETFIVGTNKLVDYRAVFCEGEVLNGQFYCEEWVIQNLGISDMETVIVCSV
jgi:arginine N-succinyltransferase